MGSLGVRAVADQADGVDEEDEAEHEEKWAQVAAPEAAVADDHLDRSGGKRYYLHIIQQKERRHQSEKNKK